MTPDPRLAQIAANYVEGEGCWEWKGSMLDGYGLAYVDGRSCRAARVMYEIHNGPIEKGLEVDHLCRNKACVRPDHLEAVTHAENMRRIPLRHGPPAPRHTIYTAIDPAQFIQVRAMAVELKRPYASLVRVALAYYYENYFLKRGQ